MNHGLQFVDIQDSDYVQDSPLRLGGLPLVPDGQWDAFLPADELQDKGLPTMACASFGTKHAVEILLRQEFSDCLEHSGRFLAEISGTTQSGNDPHTVAETLRKQGIVHETDWPYSDTIHTWGDFYQTPPDNIKALAKTFNYEYDFAHEWCKTDQQSMMNALMYSPLGADVFAWNVPDADGIYHRNGMQSEHWIVIYGYVANNYWKCFDTYDNTHKKLAWDFGFGMVKKYTLHKQVISDSWWETFLKQFRAILGLGQQVLGLGDYDPDKLGGATRSPQWEELSRAYRKEQPLCEMGMHKPTLLNPLNTHHVEVFHEHPELELVKSNWINLCRFHHLWNGHLGNWKSNNDTVREDATAFTEKVKNRP